MQRAWKRHLFWAIACLCVGSATTACELSTEAHPGGPLGLQGWFGQDVEIKCYDSSYSIYEIVIKPPNLGSLVTKSANCVHVKCTTTKEVEGTVTIKVTKPDKDGHPVLSSDEIVLKCHRQGVAR